jgi:membrane fusion protein, multidrug efflux system
MKQKAVISVLVIAALAAGGVGVYTNLRTKKPASAPAPPPAIPVVAEAVKSGDVPIYLSGIGTVVAYNIDVIRSQITGQLTQIAFTQGQAVKAGDLLAQIDPRPYQAQLNQFIANLDRDKAQLQNAQANLGRYKPLASKGFATQQLLDTQNAQVAELQAAIKSDEALVEAAKIQLGYTRLTSPIDGVTGILQLDIGNIIYPTTPNGLVVVTQIEPISVVFTLPENDLPEIQQKQKAAKGPLTVFAYSQDGKSQLAKGQLLLIDNQIDQTTGQIRLKANFPNKDHRLWPGQLINTRLLLDTRHDGLTVSASAIQQGQNGSYAYVIEPGNVAKIQPVKVAQITDGQALIDSGLSGNEEVVVDGQYKLQPGSHVTALTGKAAEEARAQTEQQMQIP